ncbi:MAG: acetate--CoA ligase family protein, partial [Gammaproteobacteria bacterium]|nr:acetate--CoA ligase family protein [Gammaproteobacteria bacterium]
NEAELLEAYHDLSARLGAVVNVAPMAESGVEMILGARHDPQFGAIVIIGSGGVLAETLHDVAFALPPFSAEHARRCVDRLQLRPLLDGTRGEPAVDIDAFCETASRFSTIVYALRNQLGEIDINPLIVHQRGCTIVDALIVSRSEN